MRNEVIQAVLEQKIIAIVRGVGPEQCLKVADALYEGGIRLMEITYDQAAPDSFRDTADAIRAIAGEGKMLVGAGTVTSPELAAMTAEAGGLFVISPDVNTAVIQRARALGLVSIPGAVTPTEIMTAHRAGADFVKIFPAGNLGETYIKAIRAPISHVKMIAVGGVNEKNAAQFLKAGVAGIGVGGNLVNKQWIADGAFDRLTETARALIAAVAEI